MVVNKKSEASELIDNFIENSLGSALPKEYEVATRIVEAVPIISRKVKFALDLALIRAVLSGEYPQLLNLEQNGDTFSNIKAVISAFTNNKEVVTIRDLIELLKYGGYDCFLDQRGYIAATLLYINLYDK